jgi:hypothetical protein
LLRIRAWTLLIAAVRRVVILLLAGPSSAAVPGEVHALRSGRRWAVITDHPDFRIFPRSMIFRR